MIAGRSEEQRLPFLSMFNWTAAVLCNHLNYLLERFQKRLLKAFLAQNGKAGHRPEGLFTVSLYYINVVNIIFSFVSHEHLGATSEDLKLFWPLSFLCLSKSIT